MRGSIGTYEIRCIQVEAFIKARGVCDTLVAGLTPRQVGGGASLSSVTPGLTLRAGVCEAEVEQQSSVGERMSWEEGGGGSGEPAGWWSDEVGAAEMDESDGGIEESKGGGIVEPPSPGRQRAADVNVIERLVQSTRYRQWIWVVVGNEPGAGVRAGVGNHAEVTSGTICVHYTTEGYGAMIQDAHRNAAFRRAVRACSREDWVEIGTGATAFLTLMVLEHHSRAHIIRWASGMDGWVVEGWGRGWWLILMLLSSAAYVTCYSVETNPTSWRQACGVLRAWVATGQVVVLQGYSSDRHVYEAIQAEQGRHPCPALLQELVGFIGTSEGVATVVGHMKAVLGDRAAGVCYIPSLVATFYTLVHVAMSDVVRPSCEVYVNPAASTLLVR